MDHFSIALVCSGNRFRSPLAEAFLRRLTIGLPVDVESFGTLPLGPAPALPEARELGAWHGVDVSQHRARLVGTTSLADADLVVGFEHDHVRHAVVEAGAPRERSFTFREIVELLDEPENRVSHDLVVHARELVKQAAARRPTAPEARLDSDVADPFGRSWRVYRDTAAEIRELSLELARRLFGVDSAAGLPALPTKIPWRFRRRR